MLAAEIGNCNQEHHVGCFQTTNAHFFLLQRLRQCWLLPRVQLQQVIEA
jgi:hypothetical protein